MKKKIISIIFAWFLILTMWLNVSATSNCFTYTVGNKTIIFDSNTTLNDTTREHIVNILTNNTPKVAPCGLLCIFGHNYETEYVTTITHYVNDTEPCCLEERFQVDICSRCDDSVVTRISFTYVSCCPPVEN